MITNPYPTPTPNPTPTPKVAYEQRVMRCKEPMLSGTAGRVIRLAGGYSDVTNLTLERHGSHILPIVEHPATVVATLERFTHGGCLPIAWQVENKAYGKVRTRFLTRPIYLGHALRAASGHRQPHGARRPRHHRTLLWPSSK